MGIDSFIDFYAAEMNMMILRKIKIRISNKTNDIDTGNTIEIWSHSAMIHWSPNFRIQEEGHGACVYRVYCTGSLDWEIYCLCKRAKQHQSLQRWMIMRVALKYIFSHFQDYLYGKQLWEVAKLKRCFQYHTVLQRSARQLETQRDLKMCS